MNTSIQKYRPRESKCIHRVLIGILTAVLLVPFSISAGVEDVFQQKVLFSPTKSS
jgi:hypothetical protein